MSNSSWGFNYAWKKVCETGTILSEAINVAIML
uniref:Uncharacterized protein n=1 Tax=Anguilla anguilla TaxID=7936 RepID=A0A0E9S365_ANGAN